MLVLISSFEADQVHAPFPAVVPGVEPVPLGVLHTVVVVLPAEPVEMPIEPLDSAPVDSCKENCVMDHVFPPHSVITVIVKIFMLIMGNISLAEAEMKFDLDEKFVQG